MSLNINRWSFATNSLIESWLLKLCLYVINSLSGTLDRHFSWLELACWNIFIYHENFLIYINKIQFNLLIFFSFSGLVHFTKIHLIFTTVFMNIMCFLFLLAIKSCLSLPPLSCFPFCCCHSFIKILKHDAFLIEVSNFTCTVTGQYFIRI